MSEFSEDHFAGKTFEAIVRMYSDTILRACLVHCSNSEDAKDCFQNTFLKLYTSDKKFNEPEHVKAWLLTVAMHECAQQHRSRWNRCVSLTDDYNSTLLNELEYLDDSNSIGESGSVLEQVLKLAPIYREVIYLYYYEEQDVKHIARTLGINTNTVKTRLSRGRKLLQVKVKEEFGIC